MRIRFNQRDSTVLDAPFGVSEHTHDPICVKRYHILVEATQWNFISTLSETLVRMKFFSFPYFNYQ